MTNIREISSAYFAAWRNKDFAAMRAVLADDASFAGPLAIFDNADDCAIGLQGISRVINGIEILKVAVDGNDVLTWFTLFTTVAPPQATVIWLTVIDGKITTIRTVYDPRGIITSG